MSKTSEQYRLEGNQHLKHNRLTDALNSYSMAILINSNDHINYSNRAKVYLDLGQYENALNDSETCLLRDKSFWKGYHRKATSLMKLKRLEEAMKTCSESLNLFSNPNDESFKQLKQLKEEIESVMMMNQEKNNLKVSSSYSLSENELSRINFRKEIEKKEMNGFFKAISENDCNKLKELIDQGCDVNQMMNIDGLVFMSSVDGLMVALGLESRDAFELLLNSGCTYDKKTDLPFKFTVFHIACSFDQPEYLALLLRKLEEDSNTEKTEQFIRNTFYDSVGPGYSPFLIAIFKDSVACVEGIYNSFMVKNGILDKEKLTLLKISEAGLLHIIAQRGAVKVLRFLIDSDIIKYLDVDEKNPVSGSTPLHNATIGNGKMSRNMGNYDMTTPLICDHSFETCCHSEIIDILATELGANLFIQNNDETTPLASSVLSGHFQCTRTLIEVGSLSQNQHFHEMKFSLTALACIHGHSKCLEVLLDNNVRTGNDALQSAIVGGHFACCKMLLERGVISDINVAWEFDKGMKKHTPLTLACLQGNLEIVKLLLNYPKQSINVNQVPPNISLPLHSACRTNHPDVVSYLLSKGADPFLADFEGNTILMYAASFGNETLVDIIFQHLEKIANRSTEDKMKITQFILFQNKNNNCLNIAANSGNLNSFDAIFKNAKKYGILMHDVEETRLLIQKEAKKRQKENNPITGNLPKEEELVVDSTNIQKKEQINWDKLSDTEFEKKMRELFQETASTVTSSISESLTNILDEFMINPSVMKRLSQTNLDLEWYELLFKPDIKEIPFYTLITLTSNLFIYMNQSKKNKIKQATKFQSLFGKLLFGKERFNSLKLLAGACCCIRHLYLESFIAFAIKLTGGSMGGMRNNALFLLMSDEPQLQMVGATIFQDIHNVYIGQTDLVGHHNFKLRCIGGFEIIVSLLEKQFNSGLKLYSGNSVEVLFNILGAVAWDFPMDIYKCGAIKIAAQYIDNLEYIDTAAGEKILSVFFGVLQNVNTSTRKQIEKELKLYDRLKALLKETSRGAGFINYTLRSIFFVTDFKNSSQSEKESLLGLIVKALPQFIPFGTTNFNENQVALGRHAYLVLSAGCNNSNTANFILDNTDNGFLYYIGMCRLAPVRLQVNLLSFIAVLLTHSNIMNNPTLMNNREFVNFLSWVTQQSQGYDQQLKSGCMSVISVIASLYKGVVPKLNIEGETESGNYSTDISELRQFCSFCAKKPCKSRCGDCKVTYYCSRDCQMSDWNFHKVICKKLNK